MDDSARTRLLDGVGCLAHAPTPDAIRVCLENRPILRSDEVDAWLTEVICEGLAREDLTGVSIYLVVRHVLGRLLETSVERVWQEMGGIPLSKWDPIARLAGSPQPTPDAALQQVLLCRQALCLTRPETEPALWAYLQFLLADRLSLTLSRASLGTSISVLRTCPALSEADRERVGEAVSAYCAAERVWEMLGKETSVARMRYERALLLIYFVEAPDRATVLQEALDLLDLASGTWTEEVYPTRWSQVQAALGLVLENMPTGLDADTLERAIGHYEAALHRLLDPRLLSAVERAGWQYHLAILYLQRHGQDRIEQIDQALKLLEKAAQVRTRKRYPLEWADTQFAIGNAWQQQLRGDLAQNLEKAIVAYDKALLIWTRERDPLRWAMVQRDLAEAYRNRVRDDRAENQDRAIDLYEQVLSVYTQADRAFQWASVQSSLANLWCNRLNGDRGTNIGKGIACYKQAQQVFTRQAYPRQWAQVLNNLANAVSEQRTGDRVSHLHEAIDLYEQALEVRTREAYPRAWADTEHNLGATHADLEQWDEATVHYERARQVRTVEALPDRALATGYQLGTAYLKLSRWKDAALTCQMAERAGEVLYQQAISEAGKRAELARRGPLMHGLAYALARDGDLPEAILALERGRARLLSEALARDRAMLDRLAPEMRARYNAHVKEIRALERQLRIADQDASETGQDSLPAGAFVEITDRLAAERRKLDSFWQSISQDPEQRDLAIAPTIEGVRAAVLDHTPLVYLVATAAGGAAFILHVGGPDVLWLDELTVRQVQEKVQEWFKAYGAFVRRSGRPAMKESLRWLWHVAMGQVVGFLRRAGYPRAVLVPTGLLGLLPLHAALCPVGSTPHYALDEVAFAYAPSAQALVHARRRAVQKPGRDLLAVGNVDPSLPASKGEVCDIAGQFIKPWVLEFDRATRNTVLKHLADFDVYHFSCHGAMDWRNALESRIVLFEREALTVRDLLGAEGRFKARLAFLSACETGIPGMDLPDEVLGLASGFVQAGAAGVISTLWKVADKSTAELAKRFYARWKRDGLAPIDALAAAQRELRDQAEKRFQDPYYWAPFALTGV